MELYERIRHLAEVKDVSLAKIAKSLGVPQQTFHQWLKPGSQKNIWEHLPEMMKMFPDISPEWLYMGKEPVLKVTITGNVPEDLMTKLQAENERLKTELAEADRVNRKLTARLLVEGTTDKAAVTATAKTAGQE